MSEYLAYNLTEYLMLTLVFFILILAISLFIYNGTKKIDIHKKSTRYFGLISALKNRQISMLCVILIRMVLILYSITIYKENIILTIIMILFADLIYICLRKSIFEIINIIAQVFLIYLINILNEYRIEISQVNYVFQIQIILAVFLTIYVIYFFIKNFFEILTDRKTLKEKIKTKKSKNNG